MLTTMPTPGASGSQSFDDRVDLGELGGVLARRWLIVLGVFASVVGAALLYLAVATPIYKATASILLDPRGGAALTSPDLGATRLSQDTNLIESQVRLVTSSAVLGRVVDDQHLADDPEFEGAGGGERLLDRLHNLIGRSPSVTADDGRTPQRKALAALADHVEVKRSERSLVLDIDVRSRDPAKSARLADAVAASFVQDGLAAKAGATIRESGRLDDRLRTLEGKIREGEEKVEDFRRRNSILDVSNGQQGEQQLNELNTQLVRASQASSEARARLAQVRRLSAGGASLDSMPDGLRSGTVATLRSQYAEAQRRVDSLSTTLGPRHPDLIDAQNQLRGIAGQIAAELARVALGLKNDVDVLGANEAAAQRALDAKKAEIARLNGLRVDLRTLERGVASDRSTYDRLLSADATIQQESAPIPIARQLAPALVPLRPASPNVRAILLIAAGLGLALGLAAALMTEGRARRRRDLVAAHSSAEIPPPEAESTGRPTRYVRRFHGSALSRPTGA